MGQTQRLGKVATSVFTDRDGYTKVIYHNTCVIKWNAEEIILNSGGFLTATTKMRINQASNQFNLGVSVVQTAGNWSVYVRDDVVPFYDGVRIPRY